MPLIDQRVSFLALFCDIHFMLTNLHIFLKAPTNSNFEGGGGGGGVEKSPKKSEKLWHVFFHQNLASGAYISRNFFLKLCPRKKS